MLIPKKIKIIFILPSLKPGGAERVISFISQHINKTKFHPILIIAGCKTDTDYLVNISDVFYLNKTRILSAIPAIAKHIHKHKPDIVLSSISHVNTAMAILSIFFRETKFIGREATILSKRRNEKRLQKWSPFHFLPNGSKYLDALICQSEEMAQDMINNFDLPENKVFVINNPISETPKIKHVQPVSEVKSFITVGRLTEVKGHFRLLDVLSKYNHPFKYTIIGDGNLKEEIFEKAKNLGIYDHITHIPFTDKIYDYLVNHDFFLQGSYVEGFPNALLESCAVGTPVIAFNAPGGTKEIIIQNVNGFLVNNNDEFLKKLNDNRIWNPEEIRNSVIDKFNKEKIIKQYETLFLDVLKQ